MAGVHIEVLDAEFKAGMAQLAQNVTALDGFLRDIGEYLVRSHDERWGKSPDGQPWATLSPWYAARKAEKRPNAPTLVWDEHLRRLQYEVHGDTLVVGSDRKYAAAHQFGMSKGYAGRTKHGVPIPWGDIPARPFLGLSDADETEILARLRLHLADIA